jgi:hypothetical protein
MSSDARKLKIVSLVTMFAGIAVAVVGIVLLTDGFDLSDLFVLVSGLATMVLGGSGARAANVPSSAKGLVPQAGVVTAVDVAATAGSAFVVSGQIAAVVAAALVAVLALVLMLAATSVKKGLEKI